MCIRDSFNTFFLSFRDRLIERYDELFGGGGPSTTSAVAGFGKKWNWYQSIYALAQGDIRRFDAVTELGINECLTFLAFEKEKSELESKQIKKNFK